MYRATVRCMRKALFFSALGLLLVVAAAAWAAVPSGGVDPRSGGLQINLGEWAIGPEAKAIRPGRVTFVVANRGKRRHGLEIRSLGADDAISGDDEVKTVRLEPGRTTRVTVDLAAGKYLIECFVSHHDERGMRLVFDVREDAPLVAPPRPSGRTIAIKNFTFAPNALRVPVGQPSAGRTRMPLRTRPPRRVAPSAHRSSARDRATPSASARPAATHTSAPSIRGCEARSSSASPSGRAARAQCPARRRRARARPTRRAP